MQLTGRSCETGAWIKVSLNGARIEAVETLDTAPTVGATAADETWLAPGFIDLQVNGYGGFNFNLGSWTTGDTSPDAFSHIARLLAQAGTTQLLPTVVTNHYDGITSSLRALADSIAADAELAAAFPGIHLEGPYISSEDGARGAHPLEYARDPDWDEFQRFQEAASGLIKIVTLAAEREGATSFIEKAFKSGVVVSIGHTAANTEQIAAAVRAGARLSTHLGNGSHAVLPRHPNYIWDQLAEDDLTACFIADSFHLPAGALKAMMRAKGPERTILVSDVVALGGLPPGIYDDGRHEILPTGKVVLAGTPYLAGAGCLLDTCVAFALRQGALKMADLPLATSGNPAQLLGLPNKGRIAPGYDADLVQFRVPADGTKLEVLSTTRGGKLVYGSLG